MTAAATIFNAQQRDIADMISQSITFQTEAGAPDSDAAMTNIAVIAEEKGKTPRPRAIVCSPKKLTIDDFGYASGALVVIFERDVEEGFRKDADSENGPDPVEAYDRYLAWVGNVVSDVIRIARTGGHLILGDTNLSGRPWRSDLDERDKVDVRLDYIVGMVEFSFGTKK